ncbi:hypothetical protein NSPZN2_10676 [Nitrospira defluvii]|uniref:Uncharacterized protein n=1 Tax=Nitrospira defluvii TaxID=330214 RepID=A0ABM8QJ36_9BACT|nr:hypothetical protein NSPZN2_10676 [Nitrospira defluvii]
MRSLARVRPCATTGNVLGTVSGNGATGVHARKTKKANDMPIEMAPRTDRDFTNMRMDVFDPVLGIRAARRISSSGRLYRNRYEGRGPHNCV